MITHKLAFDYDKAGRKSYRIREYCQKYLEGKITFGLLLKYLQEQKIIMIKAVETKQNE